MNYYNSTSRDKGFNLSKIVEGKVKMTDEIKQKLAKISKEWLDNNKPSHVPCSQEEWVENRSKGLYYKVGGLKYTREDYML